MGKGFGSYSHKPVEPVESVDQFCQPTPLYLLLFSLGNRNRSTWPTEPTGIKGAGGFWASGRRQPPLGFSSRFSFEAAHSHGAFAVAASALALLARTFFEVPR